MAEAVTPTEHPFILPRNDDCYLMFPDELENDPRVYFHGTAATNLSSILREGFRPRKALASSSFAIQSSLSLSYACESRSESSPEGVVISVKFETVNVLGIRQESFCIYFDDHGLQPEIVAYCIVPAEYLYR